MKSSWLVSDNVAVSCQEFVSTDVIMNQARIVIALVKKLVKLELVESICQVRDFLDLVGYMKVG